MFLELKDVDCLLKHCLAWIYGNMLVYMLTRLKMVICNRIKAYRPLWQFWGIAKCYKKVWTYFFVKLSRLKTKEYQNKLPWTPIHALEVSWFALLNPKRQTKNHLNYLTKILIENLLKKVQKLTIIIVR